eukprot:TRINITY_DN75159_c0_g1_i1.p1 TRINITY_DN75159_c0_g1~~TRINITY_DN75159_c0_g1_i1.p1  ORF type:complete len:429 (+),score=66.23 TRINITY_DN75159_c0_g1_i1:71-1288(+)
MVSGANMTAVGSQGPCCQVRIGTWGCKLSKDQAAAIAFDIAEFRVTHDTKAATAVRLAPVSALLPKERFFSLSNDEHGLLSERFCSFASERDTRYCEHEVFKDSSENEDGDGVSTDTSSGAARDLASSREFVSSRRLREEEYDAEGCVYEDDRRAFELRSRLSDEMELGTDGVKSAECFGGIDACCRRFLRACDQNVDVAETRLRSTFAFRTTNGANNVSDDIASRAVREKMCLNWPQSILGFTTDGNPVVYFDVCKAVQFFQHGFSDEEIRATWLMFMEDCLLQQREGRRMAGRRVSEDLPANVEVYNLKGLCFSDVTSCIGGVSLFCKVLGLGEAHYPQNCRKAAIVNVPTVFYKMVWPLVRAVLDPETRINVCMCAGDGRELISEQLGFEGEGIEILLRENL